MVDPIWDRLPDAGTAIVVAVMVFVFTVNAIIIWRHQRKAAERRANERVDSD